MASTEVDFNPFLPEFHANPYPFYHRLRAADPVHQTPMGLWVLTRYDDVVTALRDPRFGREGFEQILADVYGEDGAGRTAAGALNFGLDEPVVRAVQGGSMPRTGPHCHIPQGKGIRDRAGPDRGNADTGLSVA